MQAVTLESIKADQAKLSDLIAKFESQLKTEYIFPETQIQLARGEHYAGLIIGKDGESSYHLILIEGEATDAKWESAKEWAAEAGGELPTRREQALLYANLKEQFQPNWYWSSEQHASNSVYAWCQNFSNGSQYYGSKSYELRTRAVRRLVIQ